MRPFMVILPPRTMLTTPDNSCSSTTPKTFPQVLAQSAAQHIGQDDEILQPGSVVFQVVGDDRVLLDSGVVAGPGAARPITVDTTGIRMLSLRVTDAGDGRNFDHADWANAQIRCA